MYVYVCVNILPQTKEDYGRIFMNQWLRMKTCSGWEGLRVHSSVWTPCTQPCMKPLFSWKTPYSSISLLTLRYNILETSHRWWALDILGITKLTKQELICFDFIIVWVLNILGTIEQGLVYCDFVIAHHSVSPEHYWHNQTGPCDFVIAHHSGILKYGHIGILKQGHTCCDFITAHHIANKTPYFVPAIGFCL